MVGKNRVTRLPSPPESVSDDVVDLRESAQDTATGVQRVRIGRCLVDLVDEDRALRILDGHLGRPRGTGSLLVASANLDHVAHFGTRADGEGLDPGRMDDWLVLLDGAPFVRAAHRLTGVRYPRLTGADLLPLMFGMAQARERRVVVLGGAPAIREPLAAAVHDSWPGLDLVAHLTPPRARLLDPAGALEIRAELAALAPDLLVVALGKPLQERWMAQHAREAGAGVVVAFGAAVDFIAGSVPRAPEWMRDRGMEWAYRLWREPRRLAHRYLVQGPPSLRSIRRDAVMLPTGAPTVRRTLP